MKINTNRPSQVKAVLARVSGRASAHTFSAATIEALAAEAERELERLALPKKMRAGARVHATSGSPVAGAYRYARTATSVTITRGAAAWFLTRVTRVSLYPNRGGAASA